jgi:hypothetical protein
MLQVKNFTRFFIVIASALIVFSAHSNKLNRANKFEKIMVVVFENMSVDEVKKAPVFNQFLKYAKTGKGHGYAFFNNYYNNHNGGYIPARPSQPNYFALTSGSLQGVNDAWNHDLPVDNLGLELAEAKISWKAYVEDLPDPIEPPQFLIDFDEKTGCFIGSHSRNPDGSIDVDGYVRKHEPFISFDSIRNKSSYCRNLMNASYLEEDLKKHKVPKFSFYVPNLKNDGHNGSFEQRINNINNFLAKMMAVDPKTGLPLPKIRKAPFQQFIDEDGLLIITFDEPSLNSNPDLSMYTLFLGNKVRTGIYSPICYPENQRDSDAYGTYPESHCNHYNLLKMIENNWNLRGLRKKNTSFGYKYAKALEIAL